MRGVPLSGGAATLRARRSALLAALLAALQVAAVLHLAAVPHGLDVRGRLVHPGRPWSAPALRGALDETAARRAPHLVHDHGCALAGVLRAAAGPFASPPALPPPHGAAAGRAITEARPAHPARPLHRLAPKQSPPARA